GYHAGRLQVLPVNMTSRKASEDAQQLARQETGFMDLFARGREYVSSLTDKFSLGNKSNPGMIAVMSQSMGILEQRHKRARLMGDPPDICIVPELTNIGTMEFHRAAEAIAAGEAAVGKVAHLIEAALWKG
ncbi:MAG: patatin-like phospholipase RssA, partial [Shewanella sp.]